MQLAALSAICVSILALQLGGERWNAALRYDRAALAQGEIWRLVTAHLVHLGWRHALLNLAGLVLMWALFLGDYRWLQWLAVLAAAALAIDAGFWLLEPRLAWYVGLSGVLHGVMGAGALAHLRRGDGDGWLLAVLLVLKLVWEQIHGALPFAGLEGRLHVVVDAHLYGALGGLCAALWLRPQPRPL